MKGLIPRAIEQVGAYKLLLQEQGWEYHMEVSFVEIYNESIRDLLRPNEKQTSSLDLRTSKDGGIFVADATRLAVDPLDHSSITGIMELAARHRAVGSTEMNAQSSRSHSIFTLFLSGVNTSKNSTLNGTLNLVDLAGSERLSKSCATGTTLKETQVHILL